jgi:hypothetical protein
MVFEVAVLADQLAVLPFEFDHALGCASKTTSTAAPPDNNNRRSIPTPACDTTP